MGDGGIYRSLQCLGPEPLLVPRFVMPRDFLAGVQPEYDVVVIEVVWRE